ncbi:MAG: T9SS type A sorting domain-containing protein [Algibacter sp.]
MKKQLLTIILTLLTSITTFAQEIWYDIDTGVTDLTLSTTTGTCSVCAITTVSNPDVADTEATNVTLWKVSGSTDTADFAEKRLNFSLPLASGLTGSDFSSLVISVRLYFPEWDYITAYDSLERIRLFLGAAYVQANLLETDEAGWYNLEFDFSGANGTIPTTITSGSFRLVYQAAKFTDLNNDLDIYIDTITSTVALSTTLSTESETLKNNSLKFVTNPVENILEVSKQIKSAIIYNNLGKAIKTYDNATETKFDVSNLSSGLYIFHAKLDTGAIQNLRFVKK